MDHLDSAWGRNTDSEKKEKKKKRRKEETEKGCVIICCAVNWRSMVAFGYMEMEYGVDVL